MYRLINPRNGESFYAGKGRGNRVFAHANGAIAGQDDGIVDHQQDRQHVQAASRLPSRPLRHVPAPQHQQRAGQLAPPVKRVMRQVHVDRPVVRARSPDGLRIREASQVFRVGLLRDRPFHRRPPLKKKVQVELGVAPDQRLRERLRLTHQVPVEPRERQAAVHCLERRLRRRHIQRRET